MASSRRVVIRSAGAVLRRRGGLFLCEEVGLNWDEGGLDVPVIATHLYFDGRRHGGRWHN